jgi:hypothetical protein
MDCYHADHDFSPTPAYSTSLAFPLWLINRCYIAYETDYTEEGLWTESRGLPSWMKYTTSFYGYVQSTHRKKDEKLS